MSTIPAPAQSDEMIDSTISKEKDINSPDSPDTVALNEIEIVDNVSTEPKISEKTEKTEGLTATEPNKDATNTADIVETTAEKTETPDAENTGADVTESTKETIDKTNGATPLPSLPSSSVSCGKGTTSAASTTSTNGKGVNKSIGGKGVNWVQTGTTFVVFLIDHTLNRSYPSTSFFLCCPCCPFHLTYEPCVHLVPQLLSNPNTNQITYPNK